MKLFYKYMLFVTLVCVALVFAEPRALAQTASDLETAVTTGSQFEEAQILLDEQRQHSEDSTMLEGEPGVFILKKNDIFVLGAAAGSGFSDNPGRTLDTNAQDAYYSSVALSAGINTRIAGQYDAGLNVVASGTEYDRGDAPSNRNAITNVYIGRPVLDGRFYISANATAGLNMDRKFDRGTAFYSTGINVSTIRKFSKNVLIRPTLSVSRQWSGQGEQNNYSLSAAGEVVCRPAQKWLVRGRIAYNARWFDDFFEDVTFVKRKDNVIRAGLTVSRQITKGIDASASIEYIDQNSSFFISDYKAFDTGLNLKISRRF